MNQIEFSQRITSLARLERKADDYLFAMGTKGKIATGAAAAVGAGAAALGVHHVVKQAKENKAWMEKAKPGEVRRIADDLYVDKHGAMFPSDHPTVTSAMLAGRVS